MLDKKGSGCIKNSKSKEKMLGKTKKSTTFATPNYLLW